MLGRNVQAYVNDIYQWLMLKAHIRVTWRSYSWLSTSISWSL